MTAALVGYGRWGKNIARNLHELGVLHTLCDDIAFASPYPTVHVTADFASLLANPAIDKLFIATPPHTHYALAKQALLAGKDVFVEKPLCLDPADGEDLVAIAEDLGRVLMVGHLLHYHPCVEKIKERLSDIGEIRYISSHRLFPGLIREENVLWDLLPHDVSLLLALTQSYPDAIYSNGTALDETMDTLSVSLKFPSSIQADISASWVYPFKEQKLVVIGTKGTIVFDDTKEWTEKLILSRLTSFPKIEYERVECPIVPREPLMSECLHFLECCKKRAAPLTDGREALATLRVLMAIQELTLCPTP